MNSKEEYKALLATIKSKLKTDGKPSRNEDIAKVLGYHRSYFSTLLGASGVITDEHLKYLKLNFRDLLENVTRETLLEEKGGEYNIPPGVTVVDGLADANQYLKNKGADPNGRELGHAVGNYISKGNKEFIELSKGSYLMITPLVNKKAHAGYLTGWGDEEYIEELPKHSINVDKPYRGEYLSFETVGRSMDDGTDRSICENDIVTGRKIERSLWKNSKLHLNKYDEFIIVATEGILVKKIIKHDTVKQTITFTSYNPDKETYPDQTINIDQVMQLFNVVQVTKNRKKG